jgi:hypothetical protein
MTSHSEQNTDIRFNSVTSSEANDLPKDKKIKKIGRPRTHKPATPYRLNKTERMLEETMIESKALLAKVIQLEYRIAGYEAVISRYEFLLGIHQQ